MEASLVVARLDALISQYRNLTDSVFYLREEYLDGGRARGAEYQLEIRVTPPAAEQDDAMEMPMDDVKVGVKFAAFTRLDQRGRSRRYVRVTGATVVARLERLRFLAGHGRIQPPGNYAARQHPTLRAPGFAKINVTIG